MRTTAASRATSPRCPDPAARPSRWLFIFRPHVGSKSLVPAISRNALSSLHRTGGIPIIPNSRYLECDVNSFFTILLHASDTLILTSALSEEHLMGRSGYVCDELGVCHCGGPFSARYYSPMILDGEAIHPL